MRICRIVAGFALLVAGCTRVVITLEDRPCKDGKCLDGWACHPELQICVREVTVDCSGGGICPSRVHSGDACQSPGSFIPCSAAATACERGCRTCGADGIWSECSAPICNPDDISTEECDGVDNDCDGDVDEIDALGCTTYFRDDDGDGAGRDRDTACLCEPGGEYTAETGGDCDDTDENNWSACATCVDLDEDGWWTGCDAYVSVNGPDCGDSDPDNWVSCASCVDGDNDDWWTGCDAYGTINGQDCNDGNVFVWDDCSDCVDRDNDGAVTVCGASEGWDCNDANPNVWVSCGACVDTDGDGAYSGCDAYATVVEDCDDDPTACGELCTPGRDELCNQVDHNCDGDPYAGCRRILPTNLNSVDLCANSADATLIGDVTFNTATGAISTSLGGEPDFATMSQDGGAGPQVGVWTFGRLQIDAGATITFVGGPAAVILACDEIVVDGTVSVCAAGRTGGPGGYDGGTIGGIGSSASGAGAGQRGGNDITFDAFDNVTDARFGGGGGGGHCGGGGTGGDAGGGGTGGGGGTSFGLPEISPLQGGGGGASSTHYPDNGGREGGGGGGAVEMVAGRRVVISGVITACGAAGAGTGSDRSSGAGAGAGGAILVEAPSVMVSAAARLAANGGGGSGGEIYIGGSPSDTSGDDGRSDAQQAAGGSGKGGAGDGGPGGAGTVLSGGTGASNDGLWGRGGGGGGAVGRIRLNSLDGIYISVAAGARFSPARGAGCATSGALTLE